MGGNVYHVLRHGGLIIATEGSEDCQVVRDGGATGPEGLDALLELRAAALSSTDGRYD